MTLNLVRFDAGTFGVQKFVSENEWSLLDLSVEDEPPETLLNVQQGRVVYSAVGNCDWEIVKLADAPKKVQRAFQATLTFLE